MQICRLSYLTRIWKRSRINETESVSNCRSQSTLIAGTAVRSRACRTLLSVKCHAMRCPCWHSRTVCCCHTITFTSSWMNKDAAWYQHWWSIWLGSGHPKLDEPHSQKLSHSAECEVLISQAAQYAALCYSNKYNLTTTSKSTANRKLWPRTGSKHSDGSSQYLAHLITSVWQLHIKCENLFTGTCRKGYSVLQISYFSYVHAPLDEFWCLMSQNKWNLLQLEYENNYLSPQNLRYNSFKMGFASKQSCIVNRELRFADSIFPAARYV